ncbi:MAG: hypothetical protein PHC84_06820 [Clostridia bacterium]|nr:hypothetical protein [Clostridia bacterium]
MKKFLSLKTLAVLLILALSVVAFAACVKPNDENENENEKSTYAVPEFSLTINDGETQYTVTKSDITALDFASASRTKNEVTTYYKGFSVADILAMKQIATAGIVSLTFDNGSETDFYESDLEVENVGSCVLAVVASTTETDGYVLMTTPEQNSEDPEGPIRAVCMAQSTGFKSVKNVVNITIHRPAYAVPEFSITITDGEDEYTVDQYDVAKLDFTSASRTKNEVTTYYKGFSLSDILASKEIATAGIVSLTFDNGSETDFYESDLEATNVGACVLAVVYSGTETGEYALMTTPEQNPEDPEGPVRAVCSAASTDFRSVKNVVNITINRTPA